MMMSAESALSSKLLDCCVCLDVLMSCFLDVDVNPQTGTRKTNTVLLSHLIMEVGEACCAFNELQ